MIRSLHAFILGSLLEVILYLILFVHFHGQGDFFAHSFKPFITLFSFQVILIYFRGIPVFVSYLSIFLLYKLFPMT